MKWWYWLVLELLIIFGVIAWIYFFPSEIEDDFAKGMIGFVLIYAIEECRDINRRKTMSENYTIEQNAGDNQIEGSVKNSTTCFGCEYEDEDVYTFERCRLCDIERSNYIPKKGKHYRPFKDCDELVKCWEKKMFIPAVMFTEDTRNKLYRPSIWIKSKEYGTDNLITAFDGNNESIGGSCVFIQDIWVDMKELFDNFTFLDGSPCGLEEM